MTPPAVAADPKGTATPATKPAAPDKRTEVAPFGQPKVENASFTPAAAGGSAMHTVQRGQSLWTIALERLGDGRRFRELLELNPQLRGDPGRIVPGQSLRLPAPAN